MEEETCPGQENPLSKVHRDREAVAQNLRVRTGKACPEGESFAARQDEKNNVLDSPFRSFLILSDTFLDKFPHERGRERLVRREVDRGTADIVPLEFGIPRTCQLRNHAGTHHIERAMVLGCTEADQGSTLILENWNPIANDFGCLGYSGFDDIAKLLERDSHILWHRFEVIVDALRWRTPHRGHSFSEPDFPGRLK